MAFYNSGCENLIFDNISQSNLTKIGTKSFGGLMVKALKLPEGIIGIPEGCFSGCSKLEEINIPSKCTSIDPTAFEGCTSLARVTIGSGNAFFKFSSDGALVDSKETTIYMLKEDSESLNISSTIVCIGSSSLQARARLCKLEVHKDNDKYASYKNVLYSKNFSKLLAIPGGLLASEIHPDAVEISRQAGMGASIEVFDCGESANLKYIREDSFRNSNISTFVFPSSIEEIASFSFYNSSIRSASFAPGCNIKSLPSTVFRVSKLTTIELPDSIESMDGTFWQSYSLETVILSPKTHLTQIKNTFKETKLKNFTFYPSIKYVKDDTFANCKKLEVDFRMNQIIEICDNAFDGCISMSNIVLKNTLNYLGTYAFKGCKNITSIIFDYDINI